MAPDLDRQLADLRASLERVSVNLVELEASPTCALLDATGLQGASASRWDEARATRAELFHRYAQLTALLDEAAQVRGSRSTLSPGREAQLIPLLTGPSIELSDTAVPLAQRGLLSGASVIERCTPAELLERMGRAFESVKQVVVDAGWAFDVAVPRLRELRVRLTHLAGHKGADDLGVNVLLDPVERRYQAIAAMVVSDPLSLTPRLVDELEADVAEVTGEVEGRLDVRDHAGERLAEARLALAELQGAVAAGGIAHDEVVAKIVDPGVPDPLALDPELEARLAHVEDLARRRSWDAVHRELAQWDAQARRALAEAHARMDAIRVPLDERAALRGLLDAYRGKAAALGALEDKAVVQREAAARTALYTAPVDLRAAQVLIEDYRQALTDRRAHGEVVR